MTYTKIKNKLLNTGYFIDNDYLDLYCSLISSNWNSLKIKGKTQIFFPVQIDCTEPIYLCTVNIKT